MAKRALFLWGFVQVFFPSAHCHPCKSSSDPSFLGLWRTWCATATQSNCPATLSWGSSSPTNFQAIWLRMHLALSRSFPHTVISPKADRCTGLLASRRVSRRQRETCVTGVGIGLISATSNVLEYCRSAGCRHRCRHLISRHVQNAKKGTFVKHLVEANETSYPFMVVARNWISQHVALGVGVLVVYAVVVHYKMAEEVRALELRKSKQE